MLYINDGAWTPQEATAQFGNARTTELIDRGYLGRCDTHMGPMLLLLAPGRVAVFGTSGKAQSLSRQIDRAYLRRSLLDLGWTQTQPGETAENLWQYDTTGRMIEVRTPNGLALLTGAIRSGGIGRQNVANISWRLKSTALYHGFEVILLTPNPRKAHRRAMQEASFMTMKTVLPINDEFPDVRRVKDLPSRASKRDDIPYLAGEAWKHDPAFTSLPDLTRRIVQMKRSDRVDHALRSIECDGVLSEAQLQRWSGLDTGDITDRLYIRTIMRPTHSNYRHEVDVTFVVPNKMMAKLDDTTLGHRAGTGEMRHLMGVSSEPRHWKAEQRELLRFEEPDAYHYDEHGQIHAIEFDTGTYTANVIDDKLSTFADRGFTEVHWGVTSTKRQANLTDKIRSRLGSDIRMCAWWDDNRWANGSLSHPVTDLEVRNRSVESVTRERNPAWQNREGVSQKREVHQATSGGCHKRERFIRPLRGGVSQKRELSRQSRGGVSHTREMMEPKSVTKERKESEQ